MKRAEFALHIDLVIKSHDGTIKGFKDSLDKDAEDAFRWSERVLRAAAHVDAWRRLKKIVEDETIDSPEAFIKRVRAVVARHQAQGCAQPTTSTMSTIMDRLLGEVWGEILSMLCERTSGELDLEYAECFSKET